MTRQRRSVHRDPELGITTIPRARLVVSHLPRARIARNDSGWELLRDQNHPPLPEEP